MTRRRPSSLSTWKPTRYGPGPERIATIAAKVAARRNTQSLAGKVTHAAVSMMMRIAKSSNQTKNGSQPLEVQLRKILRHRTRLAILSASIAIPSVVLTAALPSWIEFMTGWDPDGHNGSVERLMVAGLLMLAALAFALASRKWRSAGSGNGIATSTHVSSVTASVVSNERNAKGALSTLWS